MLCINIEITKTYQDEKYNKFGARTPEEEKEECKFEAFQTEVFKRIVDLNNGSSLDLK